MAAPLCFVPESAPASKLVTGHRQCVTLEGTELDIPVY